MNPFAIAVHDGQFHADDVFATATILKALTFFTPLHDEMDAIVRTRDPAIIEKATIVLDVGFRHEPDQMRFDHHQAPTPAAPDGHPYSTFGLVWAQYGRSIVHNALADDPDLHPFATEASRILADGFVRAIDLADNGIGPMVADSADTLISALNHPDPEHESQRARFLDAVRMGLTLLDGMIRQAAAEARSTAIVAVMLADHAGARLPRAAGPRILELAEPGLKWRRAVAAASNIDFVLEPRRNGNFTLTAAPVSLNGFESRACLPRMLRGAALETLAIQAPGVGFVHANGAFAAGERDALICLAGRASRVADGPGE